VASRIDDARVVIYHRNTFIIQVLAWLSVHHCLILIYGQTFLFNFTTNGYFLTERVEPAANIEHVSREVS
jgi:hypothetical protein